MDPACAAIILRDFEMQVECRWRAAEIVRDVADMLSRLDGIAGFYLQFVHVHVHVFENATA